MTSALCQHTKTNKSNAHTQPHTRTLHIYANIPTQLEIGVITVGKICKAELNKIVRQPTNFKAKKASRHTSRSWRDETNKPRYLFEMRSMANDCKLDQSVENNWVCIVLTVPWLQRSITVFAFNSTWNRWKTNNNCWKSKMIINGGDAAEYWSLPIFDYLLPPARFDVVFF